MPSLDDAKQLRGKADELRAAADGTKSLDARRTFLRLADGYERLADRLDGRDTVVTPEKVC